MNYVLIVGIGYEESNWKIDSFNEDRRVCYIKLMEKYKKYESHYIEGLEHIEFPNGTPQLEQLLIKELKLKGFNFDIGAKIKYSENDIKNARFVPLASRSEVVDMNYQGNVFNKYKEIMCDHCGITNDRIVPNPYNVFSKRVKQPRDLFGAFNGINILSVLAFELLRSEIEPWIDFGKVQIVDVDKKPVKSDYEYIWIRPKCEVGKFVDAVMKKKCKKCGSPVEIRKERSVDIFEADKWVIESFKSVKAPIVIAGNWFGEIDSKTTSNQLRYVFISGELHEKMRKLKLKGFLKSDCIVHAADEPYEWDPLKNRII